MWRKEKCEVTESVPIQVTAADTNETPVKKP